eukprot:3707965-Prorocentrum_lima.AAC.1
MTSSLVGSEMCIRDSLFVGGLLQECSMFRHGLVPPKGELLLGGPDGRKTVSYTHLTLPTICSV